MDQSKEEQVNSSKSLEDVNEEKKRKIAQLQKDIASKKSLIVALKRQLSSDKHVANLSHCANHKKNTNSNVNMKWDLYEFAGIQCVKLDAACVFKFLTGSKVTKSDTYAVEILKADGQHRLGKWVMPMSIDLNDVALEYSIEDPKNLRPFLKYCKHHIDCYSYRRDEYYRLKSFLSDTKNCFLDKDLGFTLVLLHMLGIKMIDSERVYNVTLFMSYESNRTLPSGIMIETMSGHVLPQDIAKHFLKYFKPFKRLKLQEAFEKVTSDTCYFQWAKVPRDYDEISLFMGDKPDEEEYSLNEKTNLGTSQDTRENSLHSEQEETSKSGPKVIKEKAKKSVNAPTKQKSEGKSNPKVKNAKVKKSVKSRIGSTRDKNENIVKPKAEVAKPKESSKEAENLEGKKNSKGREKQKSRDEESSQEKFILTDKENLMTNETSGRVEKTGETSNTTPQPDDSNRVKHSKKKSYNTPLLRIMLERAKCIENGQPVTKETRSAKDQSEQENMDNATNDQSDDARNDTTGISDDGSVRTDDETERNASTGKSKSKRRVETKFKETPKKSTEDVRRNSIKKNGVTEEDKELTKTATNIKSKIISSTPISKELRVKLSTTQSSEISEILPSTTNATSKENCMVVGHDLVDKEISEEDAVSSTNSIDMAEENVHKEVNELLKDIEETVEQGKAIRNGNIRKSTRKSTKTGKKKGQNM